MFRGLFRPDVKAHTPAFRITEVRDEQTAGRLGRN